MASRMPRRVGAAPGRPASQSAVTLTEQRQECPSSLEALVGRLPAGACGRDTNRAAAERPELTHGRARGSQSGNMSVLGFSSWVYTLTISSRDSPCKHTAAPGFLGAHSWLSPWACRPGLVTQGVMVEADREPSDCL